MPRPTHLSLALMLATFAAAPAALAQAYPAKPVTIVVGYPAGGSTDLTGRTLGDALAKQLGVPVVIENLGGGERGQHQGQREMGRAWHFDGLLRYMSQIGRWR